MANFSFSGPVAWSVWVVSNISSTLFVDSLIVSNWFWLVLSLYWTLNKWGAFYWICAGFVFTGLFSSFLSSYSSESMLESTDVFSIKIFIPVGYSGLWSKSCVYFTPSLAPRKFWLLACQFRYLNYFRFWLLNLIVFCALLWKSFFYYYRCFLPFSGW